MQGCSSWKRWHQIFSLSRKIIRKPGYCWQTMGLPIISKVSRDPHLDPHMTLVKMNAISQLHYAYSSGWQSLRGRNKTQLCRTHFIALEPAGCASVRVFGSHAIQKPGWINPLYLQKKKWNSHYQQFSQFRNKAPEDKWVSFWHQNCLCFFPLSLQAGYTKDLK